MFPIFCPARLLSIIFAVIAIYILPLILWSGQVNVEVASRTASAVIAHSKTWICRVDEQVSVKLGKRDVGVKGFVDLFEVLGLDAKAPPFDQPHRVRGPGGDLWQQARDSIILAWSQKSLEVSRGGSSLGGSGESRHHHHSHGHGHGHDHSDEHEARGLDIERSARTRAEDKQSQVRDVLSDVAALLLDDDARTMYLEIVLPELGRQRRWGSGGSQTREERMAHWCAMF